MVIKTIANVFGVKGKKDENEGSKEFACRVFENQLERLFFPKNVSERERFTSALKDKNISAGSFKVLADLIAQNTPSFVRKQLSLMKTNQINSFQELIGLNDFTKIMVITRDLYANSIKNDIPIEEAVKIVIECIFFPHTK